MCTHESTCGLGAPVDLILAAQKIKIYQSPTPVVLPICTANTRGETGLQPQAATSLFLQTPFTMSDRDVRVFGKKYACPGCHSILKFRRPPRSLFQTCPHCRRMLRIQERAAAASHDDEIRDAIDSLTDWDVPEQPVYDYHRDPQLDNIDESVPNIWKFDQPWPEHVGKIVGENIEVTVNPFDAEGVARTRLNLLDGIHRRVTVYRTGEVEEMAVDGHWWNDEYGEPQEQRLGILTRAVVRDLNRIHNARQFVARINNLKRTVRQDLEILDLFIDLAIDEKPLPQTRQQRRRR